MSPLYTVLALVALQRLAELVFAAGNTRRLRQAGAVEVDAPGYVGFILLHTAWLGAMAVAIPPSTAPSWPLLGLYAALQPVRLWVVATLRRRWTTRLLVLPGAPLVTSGPYRFVRHPNYLIVIAEVAILPLAFGAVLITVLFSAANLAVIARRIRLEDAALSPMRRHLSR